MLASHRVHVRRVLAVALSATAACSAEDQVSPDSSVPQDMTSSALSPHTAAAPTPSTTTCARKVNVSTVSALSKATSSALPGDCIIVAAGTYAVGVPSWNRNGTAAQPITLEGAGSRTVFTLGGNGGMYIRANYWRVRKLRVTDGLFGIQTEGVKYVELDGLEVDNMQQAAINLRYGTNHTVVRNSRIHDTGKAKARWGEGVYVGGYASPGNSSPDNAADDNQVLTTTFGPRVRAEAIDISTGADRAVLRGNTIDGSGTVFEYGYMNSLIGLRGFGHRIIDNVLSKGSPDGIIVYAGSATFRRNRIALFNLWKYFGAFGIERKGGTVMVACDNVVTDLLLGAKAFNVSCTP